MLDLIECILDSTTDLKHEAFCNLSTKQIQYFYTHGGCYDFVKIVKHFLPDITILVNSDIKKAHCVFSYNNILYDANGEVENTNDYRIATEEDIEHMENSFGIDEYRYINGKPFVDAMIEILESCRLDSLITGIKEEKGTSFHN